jgi:hypothetical protein
VPTACVVKNALAPFARNDASNRRIVGANAKVEKIEKVEKVVK